MKFLEEVPPEVRAFFERQHELCNDGEDKACLIRLAKDERMREVYVWLAKKKFTGRQQRDFIACAWMAAQDFSRVRNDRERAKDVAEDAAKAARKLARKIKRFAKLGIIDEKGAIPARLGDIHRALQDRRLAPFKKWLKTLAQAFDGFDKDSAVFGSHLAQCALSSRQNNKKYEYLRAFAESLRVYRFPFSEKGAKANVRKVANVVLNDESLTVSNDDVQKVIPEKVYSPR